MTVHTTRFFRSRTESGLYRAVCSGCTWSAEDTDLEALQGRAATHDLDQIKEPPLAQEGFVSGLPDDWR